jgi:hypothetical protein
VEGGHYGFSRDACREGRYGCEDCFGHFEGLSSRACEGCCDSFSAMRYQSKSMYGME